MGAVLVLSAIPPVVAVTFLKGAAVWETHKKAEREKPPATAFPAEGREREQPQRIELRKNASDSPMLVVYRPSPDRNGFGLGVTGTKRAYLIDVNGDWHVTGTVREAGEEDPAPFLCEIDNAQPCER